MTPRRLRVGWLDIVILAVVAAAIAYVVWRVDSVLHYRWNWSRVWPYLLRYDEKEGRWVANLLMQGFLTTLRLAAWGIVLAAIIGLVMGLCRTARSLLPRLISRTYVELIRNIPPLVFMFIFYFFISSQLMPLLGIEALVAAAPPGLLAVIDVLFGAPKLLSNFVAGLICLGFFEGAYVTEIVRGGIQSIEKGQREAGASLGLSRLHVMRYVILPQAFQRVLPPLAGQFITLIKTSSIVSLISIQELTFLASETANSTSRVFEVWITVAGMYFVICFACSLVFARLERKLAPGRG